MLPDYLGFLPSYVVGGLFFSWLVWAYYFNNKEFKIDKKIENIILILRIFFTLFIGIAGTLFILATSFLFLIKSNIKTALSGFEHFFNNILIIFIILIWIFVMNYDKLNKKKLKSDFHLSCYATLSVPIIFLGLAIASFFSSYKHSHTYIFFWIAALSLLVLYIFSSSGSKIFEIKKISSFLYKKRNKKKFVKVSLIIFISFFLISFGIFFWLFPQTNYKINSNHYLIFSPGKIFLQKTVFHDVKDIGKNSIISNWIPISYGDLNLSNVKINDLKDNSIIKIIYEDNTQKTIKIFDLIEGKHKSMLIKDDKVNKYLMVRTNNEIFKKNNVKTILLTSYNKILWEKDIVKDELIKEETNNNRLLLVYNLSNKLDLPIIYDDYFIVNVGNYIHNSSSCQLENFNLVMFFKEKKFYNETFVCSANSCDIYGKKTTEFEGISLHTRIHGDLFIYLDSEELEHEYNILLGLNLYCN